MRIIDLMSDRVITIRDSSSCLEAVSVMHHAGVRHLPVTGADGSVVGVVTDRDLRHHLFAPGIYARLGDVPVDRLMEEVPVTAVMSAPVVSVDAGADVAEAARLMRERRIGSLPVLQGGRAIGIVTETDVLREICRADAECPVEVSEIVVSYP